MNVNVVCPHCLEISPIEKKESYTKENCTQCGESLLDAKPIEGNATSMVFCDDL